MGTDNKDFVKAVEDAVTKLKWGLPTYEFKLNRDGINIPNEPKPIAPEEKWIWVEGYKGTDRHMRGYGDYQFEIGKRYDMPTDIEIKDCHAGFHLSLYMKDVFRHYSINHGNRFFKVRALVREKDFNEYYVPTKDDPFFYSPFARRRDKLVSQSIEFISELTLDEIFENVDGASTWSEEYKNIAIECGIGEVLMLTKRDELVQLGYSEAFATYVVKKDRYDIAKVVASQPGLSMDVKALMIMKW